MVWGKRGRYLFVFAFTPGHQYPGLWLSAISQQKPQDLLFGQWVLWPRLMLQGGSRLPLVSLSGKEKHRPQWKDISNLWGWVAFPTKVQRVLIQSLWQGPVFLLWRVYTIEVCGGTAVDMWTTGKDTHWEAPFPLFHFWIILLGSLYQNSPFHPPHFFFPSNT